MYGARLCLAYNGFHSSNLQEYWHSLILGAQWTEFLPILERNYILIRTLFTYVHDARSLGDLSYTLRTHSGLEPRKSTTRSLRAPAARDGGFEYDRVVIVWATEERNPSTLGCQDCGRDGGLSLRDLSCRNFIVQPKVPARGQKNAVPRLRDPPLGTCHKARLHSAPWLRQIQSEFIILCPSSISFPVCCQSSIKILFPKVQLQGIHAHGRCDIDPSPEITSSVTSLAGPPITIATITACRCKMLHQEAGVDSNQNAGAKPAKESKQLACAIGVLEGRFLGQCARSRFTDSWYDTSGGVEDEQAISE